VSYRDVQPLITHTDSNKEKYVFNCFLKAAKFVRPVSIIAQ